MNIRKLHRVIGIIMMLPFFGWAITGFIFFIKPGYEGAYDLLQIKTYPINDSITVPSNPSWLEVKYCKTVLGNHLLVKTSKGWQQLDPSTFALRKEPTKEEIKMLMMDAFSSNPSRYGQISNINNQTAVTTTSVEVSLDWNRLSLQQKGKDTERIDSLYKIHYLQWTGINWIDKIFGLLGLTFVIILSTLGLMLQLNLKLAKKE